MPSTAKTHPHKTSLDIRLAESVVFLRAGDATGRQRNLQADAPPGMVRGLLVLNLAKPMRITSIEIELVGKTLTAWPEGVGARRVEITEEHEIYSQSYVFFRAGHTPGTGSRRNLADPRPQLPMTPPYTPSYSPDITPHLSPTTTTIMQRSPLGTYDESPARSLEDIRRAFQSELEAEHFYNRSQVLRVWTPREVPVSDSRRVSFDEDREFQTPARGGSRAGSRTPSRQRDGEAEDTLRGRKNKRFTFASALLEAMKDRVRSKSPMVERDHSHGGDVTPPRGRPRERVILEEPEKPHKELSTLEKVSEALGFELDDGREHGDGWKEFRRGVYTYPVSFAIPANSPPTLHVDYGSVTWKLKAVVHRPGAFKAKMQASQDITVIATPCEDDTEESESIIVERQWDTQMQYLIAISGRSFPLGGTMPISITFMPWTKMKIHRISVLIEERVEYWTQFKRVARTDPINRVSLLALKYPKKDGPPILPLNSDDPDVLRQSPLMEVIDPDDDLGEIVSSLMGPGPWTIRKDLQLPKAGESLHTTNKNRRSNISVSHMLKIIFRVERGDDNAVDPQTGKRKLFDIVVQTPVHILSHLCNPEYISLPPYSQLPNSATSVPSAAQPALSVLSDGDIYVPPPLINPAHFADSGPSSGSGSHTPIRSPSISARPSTTSSLSGHSPGPGYLQRMESGLSEESLPSGAQSPLPGRPGRNSRERHQPAAVAQTLAAAAGEVSEEGEAPPPYEDAVEGAPSAYSSVPPTPSAASHH
ncbi:hypothetical protein BN946_scf184907.g5 [Trametes cinnabarina]|uniref:Arrestin C-terminal-like domain-containing protein n=1 Tax=Pycnoporus cinnabarinus TaxID=5643 RepID=A0A060SUE4_PYCCI|nr:hypothetical protein BN946_scf184907.g5 [Trametes cinnabarina]